MVDVGKGVGDMFQEIGTVPSLLTSVAVNYFTSTDYYLKGFVAGCTDTRDIVVCMKGTDNINEWFQNVTVQMVDFEPNEEYFAGASVHKGFYVCAKLIYEKVQKEIRRAYDVITDENPEDAPVNVFFTGHSLGGATSALLASLFKLACVENDWRHFDVRIFNFGAPRVGNDKYVSRSHSLIPKQRWIRNMYDPVPHSLNLQNWDECGVHYRDNGFRKQKK